MLKLISLRIYFALVLSGGIIPISGWCQATAQPLRSLVQGAVEQDPRMLKARARITVSESQIDAASAAFKPSFGLSAKVAENSRWGSVTQVTSDEKRSAVASLQMNWNIFRSGGDVAHIAATRASYHAAQNALQFSRLNILAEVLEAMFDYRKASALIVSAAQYRDLTQTFSTRLERSAQLGQSSSLEVERALVRNEDSLRILREFSAQRDVAVVVLKNKFGIVLDPLLPELTTLATLSSTLHTVDPTLCNSDKLASTPLIAQHEAELEASRHQINAARAEYGPKLDLQATRNAGRHYYRNLSGDLAEKRVALTLSIPLFDGGRTRAQMQEAGALSAQAQSSLDTARTDAVVNRLKSCAKWSSVQLSAANAETAWRRMAKIMAGLEREHQLGFKNSFDVFDASRDNFAVARQFVEHVYDNRLLSIQLRLNHARGADDAEYAQLVDDALELL